MAADLASHHLQVRLLSKERRAGGVICTAGKPVPLTQFFALQAYLKKRTEGGLKQMQLEDGDACCTLM